jgi:hypothetical protein
MRSGESTLLQLDQESPALGVSGILRHALDRIQPENLAADLAYASPPGFRSMISTR